MTKHSSSNRREKYCKQCKRKVSGYYCHKKGCKEIHLHFPCTFETPPSQKKPFTEEVNDEARAFQKEHLGVEKPSHYTGTPTTTSTGTYFPSQKEEWEKELYMLIGRFDSTTGYYLGLKEFNIYLIISFIKSLLKEERERIKKEMLEVIEKV